MKVIYTTCTYNHIARAFSLAESVHKFHPECRFIICLIGEFSPKEVMNFDESKVSNCKILKASDLMIPFLPEMYLKYGTLELNAALKPYFADFIFKNWADVDEILFFDSDILLYDNLGVIYDKLADYSILLTPHALSSIDNGYSFDDRNFLSSGVFNIGFYGIKRDENSFAFLDWWMKKLRNECFIDIKNGMFAEQLCLNLVPIYFKGVHVLRHLGCNVAYWNLHERAITPSATGYIVNNNISLIFYHFSGATMDCFEADSLSKHQNRYTFTNRPDVKPLFLDYIRGLKRHHFNSYIGYYSVNSNFMTRSKLIIFVVNNYKKIHKRIFSE